MKVLVIDIGGTSVKILLNGQTEPRRFLSGPTMTPAQMVADVKELASDWCYDVISIGYPGMVHGGRIVSEPHNLAPRWVGFDFETAFGCPVKLINDAAMQAIGSFRDGIMLFLGLGTGLGSALVVDGKIVPMELAHLPYKMGTYEDYVGIEGLKRLGQQEWQEHVEYVVLHLMAAIHPDDVVIGGGNVNNLERLPAGCRKGDNANAFVGGFRLWEA